MYHSEKPARYSTTYTALSQSFHCTEGTEGKKAFLIFIDFESLRVTSGTESIVVFFSFQEVACIALGNINFQLIYLDHRPASIVAVGSAYRYTPQQADRLMVK